MKVTNHALWSGIVPPKREVLGEKSLPWQFFSEVDELSVGVILVDQRKIDTDPSAVGDLHLGVLGIQLRLDPSGVSRVDLDIGALQHSGQMY